MATYEEGVHNNDSNGGRQLLHSGFGNVRIQMRGEHTINNTLFPTSIAFVVLSQFGLDGLNSEIHVVV